MPLLDLLQQRFAFDADEISASRFLAELAFSVGVSVVPFVVFAVIIFGNWAQWSIIMGIPDGMVWAAALFVIWSLL